MYTDILKRTFDPFFETPPEAWEDFARLCTEMQYPKDTILKPVGGVLQYFHFMLEGSFAVFLYKEHTQVCLDLAYDFSFVGDMSMYTNQPSPTELVTLEPCQMLRMKMTDFHLLCESGIGPKLCRIAAEASWVHKQQQQIDLLLKTAETRYLELLQQQPGILQRTPQKIIASYLGITQQSLSRIRKGVR